MQLYHNRNNHNYLRYGHSYMLACHGCLPANVCHDIQYNRTANTAGQYEKNISVDLLCEHVVKTTKEIMKSTPGGAESQGIQRKSKLFNVSTWMKDSLHKLTNTASAYSKSQVIKGNAQLAQFIDKYEGAHLFDIIGPRNHPGLEGFKYCPYVENEMKNEEKMKQLCKEYEEAQQIATHYQNDDSTISRIERSKSERIEYSYPEILNGESSWNIAATLAFDYCLFDLVQLAHPLIPVPNDVQFRAAKKLYDGSNVVIILPTGFGKTLIHVYATVLRPLEGSVEHSTVTLCVSPLLSLIQDQIETLQR